jgi:hypothetical protein
MKNERKMEEKMHPVNRVLKGPLSKGMKIILNLLKATSAVLR